MQDKKKMGIIIGVIIGILVIIGVVNNNNSKTQQISKSYLQDPIDQMTTDKYKELLTKAAQTEIPQSQVETYYKQFLAQKEIQKLTKYDVKTTTTTEIQGQKYKVVSIKTTSVPIGLEKVFGGSEAEKREQEISQKISDYQAQNLKTEEIQEKISKELADNDYNKVKESIANKNIEVTDKAIDIEVYVLDDYPTNIANIQDFLQRTSIFPEN